MEGLSPYIKDQILLGRAVLFLGAGATISAKGTNGRTGLSGNALRDKLCDKFLGGQGKSRMLNYVSDRCIAVAGMGQVHWFLKELFQELNPTPGHFVIPKFRWRGIVTTNYDWLIERAYERTEHPHQTYERILWDRDNFEAISRDNGKVPLLKLHGCLSRVNDTELPIVLSSHDYHKFTTNRQQLVSTFREWGSSYPIIFCGYQIADENIKDILFDLTDKRHRPAYAFVDPFLEEGDISYWKTLRFDCVRMSFDDFMLSLSQEVTAAQVTLAQSFPETATSVTKLIPSQNRPSSSLASYLDQALVHVHPALVTTPVSPQDFYKGIGDGFHWVTDKFDVRRGISDALLENTVLETSRSAFPRPFFYVVKGYAGAGKSVTLKRFAWEAAADFNAPVFYVGEGSVLNANEIIELAQLIAARIFVVVDDVLRHQKDLALLLQECKKQRVSVTVVGGARTNEWNVGGEEISAEVEAEFELLDLGRREIEKLLENLEANDCLGFMQHYSLPQRYEYFREKLHSQLLVALHEATEGKSFAEIIEDEYSKVSPTEARVMYLDVCTLDRFGVGLRAGLVARLTGVTFEEFSKRLLKPLEQVIHVNYDHRLGDWLYRSRHQHIAELVFERALKSNADRSEQIVRILRFLNGAFESDRYALQRLVRGRTLAEQFSDRAYVQRIFEAAVESGLHPSVVDHQRAVFELHHPSGDIRAALHLIQRIEQAPGPLARKSIAHTKSNILRRMASAANSDLERAKYRQEALTILNPLIKNAADPRPFLTRGQLLLEELEERLSARQEDPNEEAESTVVAEMTKTIEVNLRQGLQRFPDDENLLHFEAKLSNFLSNTPRALRALEKAYAANKDSVFTVIRLARLYAASSTKIEKAIAMLRTLTLAQPLSKDAHYELARVLMANSERENAKEISHHLKRSFSSGDSHFDARFAYARHEFLFGSLENAKVEFDTLKKSALSPNALAQVRKEIKDEQGNIVVYEGKVISFHDSFAFVSIANFSDQIFMHYSSAANADTWQRIGTNDSVRVTVGFSYKGPKIKRLI
jgi:tetratricopeptide (TPR) repeat protein